MISKKEVVVILNGPVLGITSSFIQYLYTLRRQLGQPKITLFVHTWDFEDNLDWVKALEKKVSDFTNEIILKIQVEKYNSPECFTTQQKFQSLLGINLPYIYGYVGKRVWYFYSLLKVLKAVKEYNNDCFVIRFPSDISITYDWDGNPVSNIPETIYNGATKINNIQLLPKFYNTSPENIFFTGQYYPYGVGERTFMAHINLCEKIFGENFNIDKFFTDHAEIYLDYFKKTDKQLDFTTITGINRVFTDSDIIPNEAAHYLYILIKKMNPEVPVVEMGDLLKLTVILGSFSNPWFNVYKSKIEMLVPIMKLKTWKDHLYKMNPEHTLHGKAD